MAKRLTEAEVLEIRAKHAQGVTREDLSYQYETGIDNIRLIVTGQTWRHLLPADGA